MKIFFLLVLAIAVFSAEIDVKLYENADKESYYIDIEKQINIDAIQKIRDENIIKDEIAHLARLRDTALQKVQIDRYNIKELEKQNITMQEYYSAIAAAGLLQYKEEQNIKRISDMQYKLLVLRQLIERITVDEKPKLLSYQLQFAYYKLQQKNIDTKTLLRKTHKNELIHILVRALPSLKCDSIKTFNENIIAINENIAATHKEKILKQLQQEKAIIEENIGLEKIDKKVELANSNYQKNILKKAELQIQQSLCSLQNKRTTDFYKNLNEIEETVSLIDSNDKEIYLEQINIVKDMSKIKLGSTRQFFGATQEESKKVFMSFYEYLMSPLFIFNERPISLFSLFKAIALIILGFTIGMLYKRWIARLSRKWSDLSMMSVRLATNIGYYLIVIIFFMIAISSLGIDMSSISLIAGALSIGIGFGLQTVVSNLIAGIILMFERTIRIGDAIEINDSLHGVVTDMRIRSTTIRTFDNIDVIVPNSSFVQNNVVNWTMEDKIKRLHIPFSVAYDTEVEDVEKAIFDALNKSSLYFIHNDDDRMPRIRMTMMNSSSVDFELLVWIEWNSQLKNVSMKSDFLILIYNALRANNIKIPFPQLDLYIKQSISESIENGK
ncbi:mechanosensitive ion channel, MscS-like protein [Sulfurimonas gotlandica GD1]|uniref:Mechanosensitive ion channel, MscS-like protein n=1 Tax=Sulfurimonas gotlandica (strain DSM 19862 / JCM 16533 / GD1) TaxID=929558 RepID=B6BJC5_SULGG|nr:mechanosensitive ion channel domain-containing protein [Sulfurimonas gotlandica]EDZ62829.1 transporter, MscS family [Sulfurimonas gotlandica GD1]EHP30647.1 mechanosensitive ion channel, MscS-like protein [Sulfurimonas gotlandica GD1]